MTSLATPDSPLVWEAVSAALTGRQQKPTERARTGELELLSTRELVALLNAEDATVAGAVAEAGTALATAIDAIAERLARGGRLVYAGAGTSGRLAALDALECGPTFGSPPGEVIAVVADGEDAEDDSDRGAADLRLLAVGPDDAVGRLARRLTPYTRAASRPRARRVR
jgi:N-acetylmuramic acid 6-phosphate etherase